MAPLRNSQHFRSRSKPYWLVISCNLSGKNTRKIQSSTIHSRPIGRFQINIRQYLSFGRRLFSSTGVRGVPKRELSNFCTTDWNLSVCNVSAWLNQYLASPAGVRIKIEYKMLKLVGAVPTGKTSPSKGSLPRVITKRECQESLSKIRPSSIYA